MIDRKLCYLNMMSEVWSLFCTCEIERLVLSYWSRDTWVLPKKKKKRERDDKLDLAYFPNNGPDLRKGRTLSK